MRRTPQVHRWTRISPPTVKYVASLSPAQPVLIALKTTVRRAVGATGGPADRGMLGVRTGDGAERRDVSRTPVGP